MNKIKLRKYPYTYARVAAMRSMLIDKQLYHKLIKMELNSIIKNLEELTSYKKQINKLAVTYSGIDLIENAINQNLIETFSKLRRISSKELKILIDAYLLLYDLRNVKTILRAKHANIGAEEVHPLLITAGALGRKYLISLLQKSSCSDILGAIKLNKTLLSKVSTSNDIIEIENSLDKWYLNKLRNLAGRIPQQGQLLKDFLDDEIATTNIKTILRLKNAGMDRQKLVQYLIPSSAIATSSLHKLAALNTVDEVIEALKKTSYADAFKESKELIEIELALDKMYMRRIYLKTSQHPLTVMSIMSFMFAKDVEVRNLKTLVKAKQLGIKQEYIEEKLLVW